MEQKYIDRFWSKVDKTSNPNGCWEWTASKGTWGYGQLYVNGKIIATHRFSYELHNGAFDKSLFVCHSCDNPSCVNPEHLWLGTATDNHKDMVYKKRNRYIHHPGVKNGSAKLTEDAVRDIRTRQLSGKEYMAKYNILNETTIYDIWNYRSWKHL